MARYTKEYATNNPGLIPMLGSSLTNDCIAYSVKEDKSTDIINQTCVSFNKDNTKGSRAFFRDYPFVMDRHHVCIFSKKVDPEYLCLALDRVLTVQEYGWGENVANPSEIKKQHLLVSISHNANIVEKSLAQFIEYYKIQFNQYRQLISQLKSQVESFDKAFLPAIFAAEKDQFIIKYFDQWAKKNDKNLRFDEIKFENVNFNKVFDVFSPPLVLKDSQTNENGVYPVVSQSSSLINGRSDKTEIVKASSRPKVIFGDHTTALKYIDFDFIAGANSKVLECNPEFLPRFAYYSSLRRVRHEGYQRHFKNFRALEFYKPLDVGLLNSVDVQENIVEFIDEWHNWRDEIFQRIDQLSSSIDQAEEALISKTFKGCKE